MSFALAAAVCAIIAIIFYLKGRQTMRLLEEQRREFQDKTGGAQTVPSLLTALSGLLSASSDEIRQLADHPLVSELLRASSAEDLGRIIDGVRRHFSKADSAVSMLSDRVLTDSLILLPLAVAVIKAVPVKTEEAAFTVIEKFMVVRDASSRAAASARTLRAELEDTRSEKSINFTADNSRKAVREERAVIRALSQCTKENREHLQAMSREIEGGLDLLKNITEITERSKLIAFNMSIEAARMGEKGRGFKVIIIELHKLNERTFEFSHRVADLLARFRDYNTLLVNNMEEKAGDVITRVEKGMDAAEASVESLIVASSRTESFTREIARISESIDHDLDGVLESLQFQDITRQMIEGAQAILSQLKKSLDECIRSDDVRIDMQNMQERFARVKGKLIAEAKTKGEKNALMEVQL